ncbi:MAG: DUF3450 family protein [Alphaproteobacteria bacterium]|nr:DUF3450 family protein [Alphaproteobacteria bacterium]
MMRVRPIGLVLALLLPLVASAEDTRGARLAELRAEVETLRAEVARERTDLDARLEDLDVRRREIELEADRERLALERLQLTVKGAREEAGTSDGRFDGLKPVVLEGIASLRARVQGGLPYRRTERLGALDELETQTRSDAITPDKAASRLWQIVEDELALSRENTVDRQVIAVDGEERLADVARLGMVALYWRTEDGACGWAERDGSFAKASTRTEKAQIDELFTALERRMRTGWFDLPGGLPEAPR